MTIARGIRHGGPYTYEAPSVAPPLVQWRAIFAGAAIVLGTLALLSALWAALAFGGGGTHGVGRLVATTKVNPFRTNFQWWIGGTAIFAMFLGAFLAAVFSGVRGIGAGITNALTLW